MLTIAGDPLDLSPCGDCRAKVAGSAGAVWKAILNRWLLLDKLQDAQEAKRRDELERSARENLERVTNMDKGNGRGL